MTFRPLICITAISLSLLSSSCYNDDKLWQSVDRLDERVTNLESKIERINSDIVTLRELVAGLSDGAVITNCTTTDYGYLLVLSDGRSIQVRNGADGKDGINGSNGKDGQNGADGKDGINGSDGKDGQDAPAIGIRDNGSGTYYWTITINGTTHWLTDANGNKLPVCGKDGKDGADGKDGIDGTNGTDGKDGADGKDGIDGTNGTDGKDGKDGKDGVTPQIGVENGFWTVDYGNGAVLILDQDGNPVEVHSSDFVAGLFNSVTPDEYEIVFNLTDGSTFSVPRVDNFGIIIDTSDPYFDNSQQRTYTMELTNVSDLYISAIAPSWAAEISGNTLTVSAPATTTADNANCDIRLIVVNRRHEVRAFKISVKLRVYGEKTLTFEDSDYKGSGNMLGNKDWSSLIDKQQYGGPLLYPTGSTLYRWYDEGNTELYSEFPNTYGDYQFWGGGGHAISDYVDLNLDNGDYQHQLAVYYRHDNGNGGHEGSKNFCVQNGYFDIDPDGLAQDRNIACFTFKDGKARIIKEIWVTNTTYAVNVWKNGNGLSPAGGADDYFNLVAYGYDADDKPIAVRPTLQLAKGSSFISTWTCLRLDGMGAVKKLVLNLESNVGNGYGMSIPAYVAIDDITVLSQIN